MGKSFPERRVSRMPHSFALIPKGWDRAISARRASSNYAGTAESEKQVPRLAPVARDDSAMGRSSPVRMTTWGRAEVLARGAKPWGNNQGGHEAARFILLKAKG